MLIVHGLNMAAVQTYTHRGRIKKKDEMFARMDNNQVYEKWMRRPSVPKKVEVSGYTRYTEGIV